MLEIVHHDRDLIVIDKPAGLLVHRSDIDRHETRFAMQMLRDQIGAHVFPVHRLDKPTSGLLVFALSSEVASSMSAKFARREVDKRYLAVARGTCPPEGEIDHPLTEARDRMTDRRSRPDRSPQEAFTRYRRIAQVEWPEAVDRYPRSRYSLVELRPHTGRRHQLRRHLKHIGHPIIGDAVHGKGVHNRFFARRFGCARLLLVCHGLEFEHPVTGELLRLRAAPCEEFRRVLDAFGWSADVVEGNRFAP